MKKRNTLIKIVAAFTIFALGASLTTFDNIKPIRAEATQYFGEYDPYTYSGSYYDSINFNASQGLDGELRQSLTTLIKPAGFYTYGSSGETHLATQLQYADEDPTNSSNMVYLYSRDSVAKNPASSWNREHVWPQSLSSGNWGTSEGGTDILHLRPTYSSANSSRGNLPFGDTNKAEERRIKTTNMLFGYGNGTYFEPLDSVKGDVARIIMYVWTTYNTYPGYSNLNLLKVFQSYDTLLRWHISDKPDVLEGNRNDYCQTSRQKNRNPFVDHPELAWKIFGNSASSSVKSACIAAYPNTNSGDPIEATGIKLNKTSATVQVGRSLQLAATLQPSGATGTVTWTSNSTSVAMVSNSGLVSAKSAGAATITATCNGYSASCVITVAAVTNNYGSLENPLSVTDALELIEEAEASGTSSPLYVKGIVSSSTAYNTQYNNYDTIWLKSDDGKTAQALQLFRAKLDSSITDDYTALNAFKDLEVVAYGFGKVYNGTPELGTSSTAPKSTTILSVKAPEATAIDLDNYSAEIEVGETFTLNATLTPSNSTSPIMWESSDETVATVENGVVTGVGSGTAIITASVSDDVTEECVVTVNAASSQTELKKVASYVFEALEASNTEYTTNGLLLRFNSSVIAGEGLSNIVTNVSDVSKVYQGYGDYTAFGIKFGTSSVGGNFTVELSRKVTQVVVKAAGWGTSDALFVGDAASQAPGVAYSGSDPIKTLTFEISESNSVEFAFSKRGFIQSIDFYGEVEITDGPRAHLIGTESIASLHGTESTATFNKTETITFASLGLSNDTQYPNPFNIGEGTVTVQFGSGANDGKYYNTGSGIRTYGDGTITVASSKTISKVVFQWSGSYKPESNDVSNPTGYDYTTGIWEGSSNSIVLTRPTGSGHWRLQAVTVTYETTGAIVTDVAIRFGLSIPQSVWNEVNVEWPITDYGVMLFRTSSIGNITSTTPVADAYGKKNLANYHKGNGAAPAIQGENYVFSVKINITSTESNKFSTIFCAAPYIIAGGEVCFLCEMQYSVNLLAQYHQTYGGTTLSDSALSYLASN